MSKNHVKGDLNWSKVHEHIVKKYMESKSDVFFEINTYKDILLDFLDFNQI